MSDNSTLIRLALSRGSRAGYLFKVHTGADGSIYASFQIPEGYSKDSISESKLSIHPSGDTFINVRSKHLGTISKTVKKSIKNGLGYSDDDKGGDKTYTKSIKVPSFDSIAEITHIPWSGFVESVYLSNLKGVLKTDPRYQVFDTGGRKRVLIDFFIAPNSLTPEIILNQIDSVELVGGYVLPHPSLPIYFCIALRGGDTLRLGCTG